MSEPTAHGTREPTANRNWRTRVVGWIGLALVLASFPLGAVGLFLYCIGDSSGGGGPTAGLSALPMTAGVGVMILAAVAFIVGAVFYVRSADD